jgi:ribosome biogenesis GTPase A
MAISGRPDLPKKGHPEIAMVGRSNVGKSTLINALLKRKVAKTGDEPAITRQQSRWVLDEQHDLIDTPGLMPAKIPHESDAFMLAASHLIGPESYTDEDVATFLGDLLAARYPGLLRARYGLKGDKLDGYGVISAIAQKRGYLRKGGKPDYEKAGRALMQDYRSGLIGRISLETPQSRTTMLAAER